MTNVTEFQRESRRIDQLIWDGMALVRDERVLFCGSAHDRAWVKRALEVGVEVTVIESDPERQQQLADIGIQMLRGSTTMIPARDASYDAVVAFHYLHEIDPTFHALTVSELARVGKRVIVVEPAPPADRLGKRIAELYSRAKYEAGAFEEYQPIEYWRKLLAIVKADVYVQQFTFTRIAPRFLIEDTISLILDAMEIEDMPPAYIEELRELARRGDAQLSPLSRYVLVGLPGGETARVSAGTFFYPEDEALAAAAAAPPRVPAAAAAAGAVAGVAAAAAAAAAGSGPGLELSEFPPVLGPGGEPIAPGLPPAAPAPAFAPPAPAQASPFAPPAPPASPAPSTPPPPAAAPPAPPETPLLAPFAQPGANPAGPVPFGLPLEDDDEPFGLPGAPPPAAPVAPAAPLGTPFALPEDPDPFGLEADPDRRPGMGWSWEPPEPEIDDFTPPL